jgi:uncharacterized membrane protein YcaP (DUF421 family)
MDFFSPADWGALFTPTHSLFELLARGSVIYLVVFALLRLDLRRQVGGIAMPDILVIVLIAEIAGNGISSGDNSIADSAILIATILFWSFLFEQLQFHIPGFNRLMRAKKLKLVENGRLLRRNMRTEAVTREELMAQLREHGIDDAAEVKAAYGTISVIRKAS